MAVCIASQNFLQVSAAHRCNWLSIPAIPQPHWLSIPAIPQLRLWDGRDIHSAAAAMHRGHAYMAAAMHRGMVHSPCIGGVHFLAQNANNDTVTNPPL